MAEKVMYALSSGSYSDYQVHGVCESKEIAEAAATKMNALISAVYDKIDVEELPVIDESVHQVVVYHLQVVILDSQKAEREREFTTASWSYEGDAVEVAWRWVRAPYLGDEGGRLDVWGTDRERVLKVLGDQRAALLADAAYRARVEMTGGRR